jgi:hypothetical protein
MAPGLRDRRGAGPPPRHLIHHRPQRSRRIPGWPAGRGRGGPDPADPGARTVTARYYGVDLDTLAITTTAAECCPSGSGPPSRTPARGRWLGRWPASCWRRAGRRRRSRGPSRSEFRRDGITVARVDGHACTSPRSRQNLPLGGDRPRTRAETGARCSCPSHARAHAARGEGVPASDTGADRSVVRHSVVLLGSCASGRPMSAAGPAGGCSPRRGSPGATAASRGCGCRAVGGLGGPSDACRTRQAGPARTVHGCRPGTTASGCSRGGGAGSLEGARPPVGW